MVSIAGVLRRRAAVLVAAVLVVPAASSSAQEVPYGEGLLWTIEAEGLAPSHIFGTLHSADPKIHDLPDPVLKAFESATIVTLEIIVSEDSRRRLKQAMYYLDGRRLDQIVGERLFSRAVEALEPLGVTEGALRGVKPWGAAVMLSMPPIEVEQRRRGGRALDEELQLRAYKAGKTVHALESVDEQIDIFEGMSAELQKAALIDAIDSIDRLEAEFDQLVELYVGRQTGGLLNYVVQQSWAIGETLLSELVQRTIFQRNARMVERMQRDLAAGGAFIAIGALHLPASGGVLDLLTRRGYRVTRVY